jgi:hypothetical protein
MRSLIQLNGRLDKNITTEELMAIDYRYNYSAKELNTDWIKLCGTKQFKKGAQFKPGMKLCQHFCDNFWTIQNDKGLSFADAWKNPEIMDKVRLWGLQGMSQLWLSWIRRAVFMTAGLPNSSFYRPHFSKQITMMTGKKSGTLFDPCAGWGGRMLGTVSNNWKYVSCDPNVETYNNLLRMIEFLNIQSEVYLHNVPVEDFDIESLGKVDVVLTSPPYFNLEVYTGDENQSYNKFDTYEVWRDNWLYPLIDRSLNVLCDDGISAWNVMNFKKYDFVGDVIRKHEERGYKLVDTVGFDSPLANIRKLKNKDVTYIFRK